MKTKLLIAIQGPTASGKTDIAIQLAKHFSTEIISCDSRQFFRELKIGAAPPSAEQLAAVKHHFIHHLSVKQQYSAGQYERDALQALDKIYTTKNVAVLVGGSGLYANALLNGIDDFPEVNVEIRNHYNALFLEQGLPVLQRELKEKDPHYFAEVDQQNHVRLIRALEIIAQTGKPYSVQRSNSAAKRPFKIINIVLAWPREELYNRINQRVDVMLDAGLLAEAENLLPWRNEQPLNTVGYKELFAFFDNTYTFAEAVNKIKQNTRRYAKRQITWLKRVENAAWFSPLNLPAIVDYVEEKIRNLDEA